jgi:hypothetical protein
LWKIFYIISETFIRHKLKNKIFLAQNTFFFDIISVYSWKTSKLTDTNTYIDPGAHAHAHTHTYMIVCVDQYVCNVRMYGFISFTNFNTQFLYSLTICMLH